MPLVTPLQVLGILDADPAVNLNPFIATADTVVNNILVPIYGNTTPQAIATLTQIELFLSAHFYSVMRPRTNEQQAQGIIDRFDSKVNLGLQVTRYGQQAMFLDYMGELARVNYANMNEGVPNLQLLWFGRRYRRSFPYGPWGFCG